jgi:hypothetical protein
VALGADGAGERPRREVLLEPADDVPEPIPNGHEGPVRQRHLGGGDPADDDGEAQHDQDHRRADQRDRDEREQEQREVHEEPVHRPVEEVGDAIEVVDDAGRDLPRRLAIEEVGAERGQAVEHPSPEGVQDRPSHLAVDDPEDEVEDGAERGDAEQRHGEEVGVLDVALERGVGRVTEQPRSGETRRRERDQNEGGERDPSGDIAQQGPHRDAFGSRRGTFVDDRRLGGDLDLRDGRGGRRRLEQGDHPGGRERRCGRRTNVDLDDLIGELQRSRAVGHADHDRLRCMGSDASEDLDLERGVHGRERAVEDEDARRRHQRAGECEPLALAARQVEATVAEHRVEAQRQIGHQLVGPGGHERGLEAVGADGRAEALGAGPDGAEGEVLPDGAGEEERLAAHHEEVFLPDAEGQPRHVGAAEANRSGRRWDRARQDAADQAETAVDRPGDGHEIARLRREVDAGDRVPDRCRDADVLGVEAPVVVVRDADVGGQSPLDPAQVDDVRHAPGTGSGVHVGGDDLVDVQGQAREDGGDAEEEREPSEREGAVVEVAGADEDQQRAGDDRRRLQHEVVARQHPGLRHRRRVRELGRLGDSLLFLSLGGERLHDPDPSHRLVDRRRDARPCVEDQPRVAEQPLANEPDDDEVDGERAERDDGDDGVEQEQVDDEPDDGRDLREQRGDDEHEPLEQGEVGHRAGDQLTRRERIEVRERRGRHRVVEPTPKVDLELDGDAGDDLAERDADDETEAGEEDEVPDERLEPRRLIDDAPVDDLHGEGCGSEAEGEREVGQHQGRAEPPLLMGEQAPDQPATSASPWWCHASLIPPGSQRGRRPARR